MDVSGGDGGKVILLMDVYPGRYLVKAELLEKIEWRRLCVLRGRWGRTVDGDSVLSPVGCRDNCEVEMGGHGGWERSGSCGLILFLLGAKGSSGSSSRKINT